MDWGCNSVHVHLRAHTGQRDELRHDADHNNVQRERDAGPEGNSQRTPWIPVRHSKGLSQLRNEGTLDARSSRCERVDDTVEVRRGAGLFGYE